MMINVNSVLNLMMVKKDDDMTENWLKEDTYTSIIMCSYLIIIISWFA